MNTIQQTGRLARDPELRYTPNNKAVAQLTIAVNRRYAKETDEIKADFFPVVVWGKQAENCKTYLHKGSKIAITGELRTRNYDDKDGIKRYITEILASSVEFLDPKEQDQSNNNEPTPLPEASPYDFQGEQSSLYDNDYNNQINDDDLPF